MMQVGMQEAKTRLSELVKRVREGERVCLTNRGEVVAEIIVPHHRERRRRDAAQTIERLRKLAKEHPLGTYEEMMAWRREGAD